MAGLGRKRKRSWRESESVAVRKLQYGAGGMAAASGWRGRIESEAGEKAGFSSGVPWLRS